MKTAARLAQAQELTEIVVDHTDGAETNHTPNTWFDLLSSADPIGAIDILYRSLVNGGGTHYWVLEHAVTDVAEQFSSQGNPVLLAFVLASEPFESTRYSFSNRLDIIGRVLAADRSLGVHLLKNLAVQVQGDEDTFNPSSYEKLLAYAAKQQIPVPKAHPVIGREETDNTAVLAEGGHVRKDAFDGAPLFSEDASPLQIIAWIRNHKKYLSSEDDMARLILALVNRLYELVKDNNQNEAVRIVRYVARYYSFGTNAVPLAELATQLADRGCKDIAALAWALAYSRSRGGHGWLNLGGTECHPWVQNGLKISSENTLQAIAVEVALLLHDGSYSGIARHLIELCAEFISQKVPSRAWDAAYDVLRHRLPENGARTEHLFVPYQLNTSPEWRIDEALFLLLMARVSHPELRRKAAAMAGAPVMIKSFPEITITWPSASLES